MSNQPSMNFMMNNMYANSYQMPTQSSMSNLGNMNNMNIYSHSQPQQMDIPKKDRLRVKLTSEERGYFSSLFQLADKDGKGKLVGKEAADFMKKSGLSKDTLKMIWLIAAQTDPQQLERDEFNIALRLIALAQNNMEVSEESIRLNHPLPPMPVFNLKSGISGSNFHSQSVNSNRDALSTEPEDQFTITEEEQKKYSLLFNKNKDLENKMTLNKAHQMWSTAGVETETTKKILDIVPLEEKTQMNFKEFKLIFHLIYKSFHAEIPSVLPPSLKSIIDGTKEVKSQQSIPNSDFNFGEKFNINSGKSTNPQIQMNNFENAFVMTNASSNLPVTNKSVDMESLLMNEFSIKQTSSSIPETSLAIDYSKNYVAPIQQNPSQLHNQTSNNITGNISKNIANTHFKNINENLETLAKDARNETQFLSKILDEDNNILTNLLSEIEKLTQNISVINDKNRLIRESITEVRRKINIERDNLSKLNQETNFKNSELIKNQGIYHINKLDELSKLNEEYNNVKRGLNMNSLDSNAMRVNPNLKTQNAVNLVNPMNNVENSFKPNFEHNSNFDLPDPNQLKPVEISINNFASSRSGNTNPTKLDNPTNEKANKSFDMPNPYPSHFDFAKQSNFSAFTQTQNDNPTQTNKNINTDFDFDKFDGMATFKDFADQNGDDMFKKSDFDGWDKF